MNHRSQSPLSHHRLREARLHRGWSQRVLADRLGTTTNNVSRWELGQTSPGPYFRAQLCALFGKSEEELGLVKENAPLSLSTQEEDLPAERTTPPPSPEVLPLWTVPFQRNPHFTGRDEILEQLERYLSPGGQGDQTGVHRAALTQPLAVKGLGGIGKTQIAVEYAYRAREQGRFTHILWVNAASEEAIMSSFVTLAELLPAFAAKGETDQHQLVAAVKRWVEQCPHPWLLIFDNADEVRLVQEYLPQAGNGSILLTTRTHAVGSLASSIAVERMSLLEGTHLLLRRAQRFAHACQDEINEAGNLVVALDQFPLALDQAGAYLEETGCDCSTYLQLYQDHRQLLLARRGTQVTHYPDSVATTWSLSFQRVEQANPAAAELLRLCAFLSPDHIPEELLGEAAGQWPPLLQQAAADPFTFNQLLEALLTFSLVKRHPEDRLLSIHRLVQAVQMDLIGPEEQRQWAERVIRAVNARFPRDPQEEVVSWPQCLRYLEQAQQCDTLIQQYQLLQPEAVHLLNRTAIYLREHASYPLAEPLLLRALHLGEQQFGPEHIEITSSLTELADLYREQGRHEEAELLLLRALHIFEQQFGSDHPNMARPLNKLATLYNTQGKYAEAEPLYQRALHIFEQQFGPEHIELAPSLNGLAQLYYEQGSYEKAEPFFLQALRIWEQTRGREHPKVADPLNNLANLYADQGKYAEAEPLYQRALRIFEQQFGPDHPKVAALLNNLGELYREQGKYAEAEPLLLRALQIRERTLGPEHALVASPLNNLGELYREQGKYAEAEPLILRALRIWEQQLGPEHSIVSWALDNLANLYADQGKHAEAERLFLQTLSIREHTLEASHSDTAVTLHGFARLREVQGDLQEAASLYRRALAIRDHVYGPQHPKTIETCERLRGILIALGRDEEAAQLDGV